MNAEKKPTVPLIWINGNPHSVTIGYTKLERLCESGIRLIPKDRVTTKKSFAVVEYDPKLITTEEFILYGDPPKLTSRRDAIFAAEQTHVIIEASCKVPQESLRLVVPQVLDFFWADEERYAIVVSAMVAKFVIDNGLRKNIVAVGSAPGDIVRSAAGDIIRTECLELY